MLFKNDDAKKCLEMWSELVCLVSGCNNERKRLRC